MMVESSGYVLAGYRSAHPEIYVLMPYFISVWLLLLYLDQVVWVLRDQVSQRISATLCIWPFKVEVQGSVCHAAQWTMRVTASLKVLFNHVFIVPCVRLCMFPSWWFVYRQWRYQVEYQHREPALLCSTFNNMCFGRLNAIQASYEC